MKNIIGCILWSSFFVLNISCSQQVEKDKPISLEPVMSLAVIENHKILVYDMMEKSLLVFEDDRL